MSLGLFSPVQRAEGVVRMLDQRKLPQVEIYLDLSTPEEVAGAIRDMVVRGAPAIGISAAFGLALGATQSVSFDRELFDRRLEAFHEILVAARPTAVNLRWAADRMLERARHARRAGSSNQEIAAILEQEAETIRQEDLDACRAMGAHGAGLVPDGSTILTHCNAGGLATAGYGTALGVVRGAVEAGKKIRVLADETRPFMQGARLTAWELMRDGIETVLIADSTAGSLMQSREVDLVVVGADRIAANGDTANKIGTYSLAVLARENKIPFYVAAPLSTIDFDCTDGSKIAIEERDPREITELMGVRLAPAGVGVRNPAFDVTPARYITGIVSENGIARPPFLESLRTLRDSVG